MRSAANFGSEIQNAKVLLYRVCLSTLGCFLSRRGACLLDFKLLGARGDFFPAPTTDPELG